jgi:hypothetical protein
MISENTCGEYVLTHLPLFGLQGIVQRTRLWMAGLFHHGL